MRAMVITRFGGPEVFAERELEDPHAGPGEVRVRVIASGTNPVDAKLRQNGSWAGLEPPVVLGYDVAGVVDEVGPGVGDFAVGDEVYYTPEIHGNQRGSYAEYNVVAAPLVARKPRDMSFEQAAAIPLAGGTAWEAVVRRLAIRPGETILIHGASGGVGSFAVQFARAAGARVLATASSKNQQLLTDLGADVAIDYAGDEVTEVALRETGGKGVDAVFDIQGPDVVGRSLAALRPFGRIACILPPAGDLGALYLKNITLFGTFLTREGGRLDEMRPLFERNLVEPLIDEVLPLDQVQRAHERLDSGHGRGKVVLKIAEA